jgi:dihydrodipicolinate synthase/N-acetylneuraminate lyase
LSKWEGVFTILLSAYTKGGKIDKKAITSSVEFVINGGVHGVVPLGSFGENPYLRPSEKRQVIDTVVDHANGRVPVIAGTGEFGTDETIELSKYAIDAGADGVMVCLPCYWGLRKEDVIKHYKQVSSSIDGRMMIYNIPSTTHLEVTPDIVAELSKQQNIVGIKESINDVEQIQTVVNTATKPFSVFVGMSSLLLEVGGDGCLDPVSNTYPEGIVKIYSAYKSGDIDNATKLQNKLSEHAAITQPGGAAFIAARKEVMRLMGIPIESIVKEPLPQLTDDQKKLIKKTVEKAGLLNKAL